MDDQQQPLTAGSQLEQRTAQHRSLRQAQARLQPLRCLRQPQRLLRLVHFRQVNLLQRDLAVPNRALLSPIPFRGPEPHTQGIVMLQQMPERLPYQGLGEHSCWPQQHRLIEVMRLLRLLIQIPVLDRCEGKLPHHRPLLGHDRSCSGTHRGQLRDRLVIEDLSNRQLQAGLRSARHHLDRLDRVSPELEEVVADAHLIQPQHLAPDPRQRLLHRRARGHIRPNFQPSLRRRQSLPVDLPAHRQRQL